MGESPTAISRAQSDPEARADRRQQRRRRTRRRRFAVGLAAAVAVSVLVATIVDAANTSPKSALRSARASATHGSVPVGHGHVRNAAADAGSQSTVLGPYGVESKAIIAENERPGTSAWMIQGSPGAGSIDGFSNPDYAAVGQSIALYVSTTAPWFVVTAYRMGWYQGLGARAVWTSPQTPGVVQPPCPLTPVTNMVSCDNWSSSLTIPITLAFVPGDYLLKLVGSGGQQAYVPLTIWDPSSRSTYLVMNRTFTEEGWNTYGGYDFYQGHGPCPAGSAVYPPCNRARVVSLDRPFASGDGSSDFLENEYPFVEFAEEHGLDVSYVTDLTVDEHPSVILQHRTLISLDHDEAWSNPEREAAVEASAAGVNIAFLGAAALVRHVRMQASPLGPDREEVDYRDSSEDPLNGKGDPMDVTGNTWESPPTDWSANAFVGDMYSGYLAPGKTAPLVITDASAWIFKGTGLENGSVLPGMIASDIDHLAPPSQTPADLQVLGHSPIPLTDSYTNQGEWGADTYSDMTYYTNPVSEGGVFDAGDNVWVYDLKACPGTATPCFASTIGTITGNLLRLFGQGPAGDLMASVANWQTIRPLGS